MKRFFTLLTTTFLILNLFSNSNNLIIRSVNSWWYQEPGIISNMQITVSTSGYWAELEVIMDFDASNTGFGYGDSLEVDMFFTLPQNAIVTDLWLWIFGLPEKAFIMDTWTATLIYESIVQRRIDPALLRCISGNEYHLQVFPIMTHESRKIKLTYLIPIEKVSSDKINIELPAEFLELSESYPEQFQIFYKNNDDYSAPILKELPEKTFEYMSHPEYETLKGVSLNQGELETAELTLELSKNKTTVGALYEDDENDEKFFQLSFVPAEIIDNSEESKKTVYLLDFVNANCNYLTDVTFLNELESHIRSTYSEKDSINILVSGTTTDFVSPGYFSCSAEKLNIAFNTLRSFDSNDYSTISTLLTDGINFIHNNDSSANLILISSGYSDGSQDEANDIVEDVTGLINGKEIIIHVLDLNNNKYSTPSHWIGGNAYYGNEYLYNHLTLNTSGEFPKTDDATFSDMLFNLSIYISSYFKNFQSVLTFTDGYAYSYYHTSPTNGFIYKNQNINIIGKYIGNIPIQLEVFAQTPSGEVVNALVNIDSSMLMNNVETLPQVWSKSHINQLSGQDVTNLVAKDIVETSINNRVLCEYTAFLVLEPGFIPEIPVEDGVEELIDGGWIPTLTYNIEKPTNQAGSLTIYPNPVNTTANLSYEIPVAGETELIILNTLGKQVASKQLGYQLNGTRSTQINCQTLPEGVYFCLLVVDDRVIQKQKLIITR